MDAKDEFYYELGVGNEYKGFVVDLFYQTNYSSLEGTYTFGEKINEETNFNRLTLGTGCNFGF